MKQDRAVILLSGGLDSATTGAMAREEGFELFALTFRYGQRHEVEIEAAWKVAEFLGISDHRIIDIDLRQFGGSALTDLQMDVPKGGQPGGKEIPVTYVPARNTIFLSYALAWAEVLKAYAIFIGVNAADYSGYPDCRPEFIEAFERMANLATRVAVEKQGHFKIHTPILNMSKAEIIQAGHQLGFDYSLTHSCYDPDEAGRACGSCDSCQLRQKGFAEAQLEDPIEYTV